MARASIDAAAAAAARVAAVRDDPAGRIALLRATYDAGSSQLRPFRRAALSFIHWELRRGVLAPHAGSAWWRALNERLLSDGLEATGRASGLRGEPSSEPIAAWMRFLDDPCPSSWYCAHNQSVVAAYLQHRELAERENRAERFFINVVLLRVLYAHALVAAPELALGRLAPVGRVLGDPRFGIVGLFLSLRRTVPEEYPLRNPLEDYLRVEHGAGRTLDYAVIGPRLQRLYDWSAQALHSPGLRGLIDDGAPVYAWPIAERALFKQALPRRRAPLAAYSRSATRSSSARRRPGPG